MKKLPVQYTKCTWAEGCEINTTHHTDLCRTHRTFKCGRCKRSLLGRQLGQKHCAGCKKKIEDSIGKFNEAFHEGTDEISPLQKKLEADTFIYGSKQAGGGALERNREKVK